jgi:hypothetical protein
MGFSRPGTAPVGQLSAPASVSERLGAVLPFFDLPAPKLSLKVQVDSRQCGDEVEGRSTRVRPQAGTDSGLIWSGAIEPVLGLAAGV